MSDLSNDTKKHTTKSRETIPLNHFSNVNDTAEIWQKIVVVDIPMKFVISLSAVSLIPLKPF
jgi:hypothetical protein